MSVFLRGMWGNYNFNMAHQPTAAGHVAYADKNAYWMNRGAQTTILLGSFLLLATAICKAVHLPIGDLGLDILPDFSAYIIGGAAVFLGFISLAAINWPRERNYNQPNNNNNNVDRWNLDNNGNRWVLNNDNNRWVMRNND